MSANSTFIVQKNPEPFILDINHELTSKTRRDMAKQKLDIYLPKATSFCQSSELHNVYFSRHKKAWNLMNCALQTSYFLPVYFSFLKVEGVKKNIISFHLIFPTSISWVNLKCERKWFCHWRIWNLVHLKLYQLFR